MPYLSHSIRRQVGEEARNYIVSSGIPLTSDAENRHWKTLGRIQRKKTQRTIQKNKKTDR